MFKARHIHFTEVGSNSRTSFLTWIGLKQLSIAAKEKVKAVEKDRKVRVLEKGNHQKETLLEIRIMDDSRLIQFRYKKEK